MTQIVFPDSMLALRNWLRVHPLLADLTGSNWFFRLPAKNPPAPYGRVYRVGGGPQQSEAPKQDLRVAHEVWGTKDSDYEAVRQTALTLESIYQTVQNELMNGIAVLEFARVTGAPDSPDPDTGWPRIVVDALLTVSLP